MSEKEEEIKDEDVLNLYTVDVTGIGDGDEKESFFCVAKSFTDALILADRQQEKWGWKGYSQIICTHLMASNRVNNAPCMLLMYAKS